jgi:hypothetical protein
LRLFFTPNKYEKDTCLAIRSGVEGARLSHGHERQYWYVEQSLRLWAEIIGRLFKLWYLADEDLLDARSGYRLRDTGQGLNRIQSSPRVSREMSVILQKVMAGGEWVGSSVVHLGDTNVPNAFMFIDKYVQVPRILGPLVQCLDRIPELCQSDRGINTYITTTYGSASACQKVILQDFFRHGFDGSGGDNFFDAGSCIDGRLTSAWNWCSQVEKKGFWVVFLMTGFQGWDGEFEP